MTKADLIAKGKTLGVNLNSSMLKTDMEKAVAKATPKSKASTQRKSGEK